MSIEEPEPAAKSEKPRSTSAFEWFVTLLSFYLAAQFGRYIWTYILFPAVGITLSALVASKVVKGRTRAMIPAFSVQMGHALWFVSAFILAGGVRLVSIDVAVLAVGLALLITVPRAFPAVGMLVYQSLSIVMNIIQLRSLQFGEPMWWAGTVHLLLRLTAVFLMVLGLRAYRVQGKSTSRPAQLTNTSSDRGATELPAPGTVPLGFAASIASRPISEPGVSEQMAEQLRRLAALADEGILTKDEFEAKKKQLLGL